MVILLSLLAFATMTNQALRCERDLNMFFVRGDFSYLKERIQHAIIVIGLFDNCS